jgi:hypothetical protein
MEWIYNETKVRDRGGLELALEEMKERRQRKFTKLKMACSGIPDRFHGCFRV